MIDAALAEREKLRELAEEFVGKYRRLLNTSEFKNTEKVVSGLLMQHFSPLLAVCANEARREEAQWWHDYFLGEPQSGKLGVERLAEPRDRLRALKAEG